MSNPEPLSSNVIIMPGTDSLFRSTYAGRTLALNIDKNKVFQAFHFYLGPNLTFAVVPKDADMVKIGDAVLRGNLIDVTDQAIKGVVTKGAAMTPIQEIEDPSLRKVFIGSTRSNQVSRETRPLFIAVPKDAIEEAAMEAELALTGRIDGVYGEQVTAPGISSSLIREYSDFDPGVPIPNKPVTSLSLLKRAVDLFWLELREILRK